MELNDIKKALYKQKPIASLIKIKNGKAHYIATLNDTPIHFEIPIIDMGDAEFLIMMDAKLLIRWIIL